MKNKFNENKGITLIALVITILVMLILAAVSISLVVGEDGVIERAKEAKKKAEIEEIVERVELAKQAILIPKKVNSDSSIISMEEFRDEILKEFDLEEKDTNGDAIIELESEYVILVFPELEYRVIDKYELDSYLYVEPKEDRWKIDDYGYISFKGTDTEIIIPKKIGDKDITKIEGDQLGFGNDNVKSVIIPAGVTKISSHAFRFCHYMENISIPEGVITIGNQAFWSCSNLKSIVLPNTVTSIGTEAFSNCHNLTYIKLSNNLISIGEYAFYFCPDLKTITIPKSVKTIKGNAFNDCKNLKTIYLEEGSTLTPPSNKWGAKNAEIIKLGEK